jgi:hypothetical protein
MSKPRRFWPRSIWSSSIGTAMSDAFLSPGRLRPRPCARSTEFLVETNEEGKQQARRGMAASKKQGNMDAVTVKQSHLMQCTKILCNDASGYQKTLHQFNIVEMDARQWMRNRGHVEVPGMCSSHNKLVPFTNSPNQTPVQSPLDNSVLTVIRSKPEGTNGSLSKQTR